jgi:hypothetical protein
VGGAFVNLKAMELDELEEEDIITFGHLLGAKGIGGAKTLRKVWIGRHVDDWTLNDLRRLLPAAVVRKGHHDYVESL